MSGWGRGLWVVVGAHWNFRKGVTNVARVFIKKWEFRKPLPTSIARWLKEVYESTQDMTTLREVLVIMMINLQAFVELKTSGIKKLIF